MKYEYCKKCWYFRKFIIIVDLKKDNEVPLIHKSKNGNTNKLGNSITREMIYNCDKHCNRIKEIRFCLDRKIQVNREC